MACMEAIYAFRAITVKTNICGLTEFIAASDIYITPYLNAGKVTSAAADADFPTPPF